MLSKEGRNHLLPVMCYYYIQFVRLDGAKKAAAVAALSRSFWSSKQHASTCPLPPSHGHPFASQKPAAVQIAPASPCCKNCAAHPTAGRTNAASTKQNRAQRRHCHSPAACAALPPPTMPPPCLPPRASPRHCCPDCSTVYYRMAPARSTSTMLYSVCSAPACRCLQGAGRAGLSPLTA